MPEVDPICAGLGVPAYLHQAGRAPDQNFAPTEKLYVRYPLNRPNIQTSVKFERQSCNRGKYCDGGPYDVRLDTDKGGDHEGFGVMAITVAQISTAVGSVRTNPKDPTTERRFTLRPDHQPLRCNYAHTEIVAYEGQQSRSEIGPASVKKQLRDQLAELFQIELPLASAGGRLPRG